MKTELRGNQCRMCEKTHEECRDTNCPKAEVSAHVCRIFGILPNRKPRKRD
jgi:hypothetical protein